MIRIVRTNKELRQFGFILAGYAVFFVYLFFRIHHENMHLNDKWIFLPLFIISFLMFPKILLPVNFAWDFVLKILHWANTRVLLGAIFFLLFSPIALYRRFLKKDTLHLHFNHSRPTYRTSSTENNDIRKPY